MAIGDWEQLTGLVLRDRHLILLRVDDGGEWELDLRARDHQFVGQRVRVEGYRADWRLVVVDKIERA